MSSDKWTSSLMISLLAVQTVLLGVLLIRVQGLYPLVVQASTGTASLEALSPEVLDVEPGDGPVKGSPEAPVTIVEFSCFTCPSCADLQPTLRQVVKANASKVRLAFRYFPLRPEGKPLLLAKAAACADSQGRFWEAHDRLFSKSQTLATEADVVAALADLDMDIDVFQSCLASEQAEARVRADLQAGLAYGVSFTPTLFVNGRRLLSMDRKTFEQAIAEALAGAGQGEDVAGS